VEGKLSAAIHLSGASGSGSERGHDSEKPFSCVKCKQVLKTREVFLKKKKKIKIFTEKQSQMGKAFIQRSSEAPSNPRKNKIKMKQKTARSLRHHTATKRGISGLFSYWWRAARLLGRGS